MAIDLSALTPDDNIITATTTSATDWDVVTIPDWVHMIEVQLDATATGPLRVSRSATGVFAIADKHFDIAAGGSLLVEFDSTRGREFSTALSLFSSGGTGERVNFVARR